MTDSILDLDVSVAHWHIRSWGGAEYLVTRLAEILGEAEVYTLGEPSPSDPNPYGAVEFTDVTPRLDYSPVRRLQRLAGRTFEYAHWEDVDWREFGSPDVLITSGATTRSVITPEETLHVHYCHSPPRWYYDLYHDRKHSLAGVATRPVLRYLRMRDASLDSRVDYYFSNSPIIQRRLWKYYKRESRVLYPPLDLERYRLESDEGFYLHLGRLDEEKGVPAIVDAFAGTDHSLVMAGGMGDISGSVRDEIVTEDNIEHRGFVDESEKFDLLATCRAVVFNGKNEDFGIVPIEANASGKPVLARDDGFPGLFVTDGENGYLHDGMAAGIHEAVERLEANPLDVSSVDVDRFSSESFAFTLRESIQEWYDSVRLPEREDL